MNQQCGYCNFFGLKSLSKTSRLIVLLAKFIAICLVFLTNTVFAQHFSTRITADSLNQQPGGIRTQAAPWQFMPGDNFIWKDAGFDTKNWIVTPTNFGEGNPLKNWRGIGWFRLWVRVDTSMQNKTLALRINHDGASEIYFDGQKIGGFGKVGHSAKQMLAARAPYQIIPVLLSDTLPHLIAVRYSNFNAPFPSFIGFQMWIGGYEPLAAQALSKLQSNNFLLISVGAQITLVLLHLFLFLFYPGSKVNLYYSLFVLMSAASIYIKYVYIGTANPALQALTDPIFEVVIILAALVGGLLLYAVSDAQLPRWRVTIISVVAVILLARIYFQGCGCDVPSIWQNYAAVYFLLVMADGLRAVFIAIKKGKPGLWLVALGMVVVTFLFFAVGSDIFGWMGHNLQRQSEGMSIGLLFLPLCFSLYLALDFARTNRSLSLQLQQVEELAAANLAQEAEKLRLITNQAEQLEQTVIERTEKIQQQANRLREMDAVKSRFMVNLTHEFRTPLTMILGPAEQLEAESKDETAKRKAGLIQQNANRLLSLINQLLDLSKLEAGKMKLNIRQTDLSAVVLRLLADFKPIIQQNQLQINFENELHGFSADVDQDKFEMICHNLFSNAVKFSLPGKQINISLQKIADKNSTGLLLTVSDEGIGIPEKKLPYVFDRFYQADASDTRSREGSGIGLALCKELVELMDGAITISSVENQGTQVYVKLPLKNMVETSTSSAEIVTIEQNTDAVFSTQKTDSIAQNENEELVLVIEDNAELREFICASLATNFSTISAGNGEEGLELAGKNIPDLIITDLMMPGMDGYSVCKQLKEKDKTSHIPVIMLTAKTATDSKTVAWQSGADGYLTKPFNHQELLALADNLIQTRKQLSARFAKTTIWEEGRQLLPSQEQVFIENVRKIVERHIGDEQFSVDVLGDKMGLSRTQLHRKLKATINQKPGELIRVIRLQRALELLKNNTGNVSEVAYLVGFGNPANFSTSFSRHFGFAPTEVKK